MWGGAILYLSNTHLFKIQMGLGNGTNNFAELITLRHLLQFSLVKQCRHLQIYGDSKIIINWFNNISIYHAFSLRHILDDALCLRAHFDTIVCHHIYRDRNQVSDQLSKEAAVKPSGTSLILEPLDREHYKYYHRPYIDIRV